MSIERLGALAAAVVVALALSALLRARRDAAPTQAGFQVPTQLDRGDFPSPSVPWLVVTFTSATCSTCADVVVKARVLACADVEVADVDYTERPEMHKRYAIDAVPTLVVADTDGVVRAAFVGPVTAQDLWAAVAECREPGSSPEPGLGRSVLD